MRKLRQLTRCGVLLLSVASRAAAQQAATVPASSGIYEPIESVGARFPVRGLFLDERPLSQRELLRVVLRLSAAIDSADVSGEERAAAWGRMELAEVRSALRAIAPRPRLVVDAGVRVDAFASDAASRRFESNGLGSIDAVSHPFAHARDGWPTGQGSVLSLAPTMLLAIGGGLAMVVEPLLTAGRFRDGTQARDVVLHRAYLRAVRWNVAAQLGADERRWGQSPVAALFGSRHAAPFPALTLGTDTAITLPWLLSVAGPARFTAFLADLGPAQDPPHARLAGWQASISPWSRFELGVAILAQTGGGDCESRGTCASLLRRAIDLVPVIDALAPQHSDLQISNKLAGGSLRIRLPELSGAEFYYELQIDDFDGRRLRSSLVDDAAHLLGARVPILTAAGQFALRLEWHRTSLRLYEHSQFRSGVTFHERLVGDPLGPHAAGEYLITEWRPGAGRAFALALANEERDPSQYAALSDDARDRGFRFVRLTNDPVLRERRAIFSLEQATALGGLRASVGYSSERDDSPPGHGQWLGLISFASRWLPSF